MTEDQNTPQVGRNEPCPCGSGKKYKRCCGKGAQPKLTESKKQAFDPAALGGIDPNSLNQDQMKQAANALKRLPRGQQLQLQQLMQKAMAGKDVTSEMARLEQALPPGFQEQMSGLMGDMGAEGSEEAAAATPDDMDVEQAKKVVEEAVASGQMTREEADKLLEGQLDGSQKKSKFWNRWFKKK